ncbi:MAG TPA: preprotein translocase subunit SecG [Gemmatimonadota bacterium]|jgi:preprotein translocase subunit SecG|nr:preprotein translocase subunit SecG [Gemmatimonadota bacterium]
MYTILLILLLIDCFGLVLTVLLQAGKGGGLAAGFGGAGTGMEMMGSRQTATFLHTATKWLGGAFLVICFTLSLLTVRGTAPRSLIESEMQSQEPAAPANSPTEAGEPGDLQSIMGGEQQGAGAGATANPAPAEPAQP